MEYLNKQQSAAEETVQKNFLEEIIENDLASGRVEFSAWLRNTAAGPISALTTPTP